MAEIWFYLADGLVLVLSLVVPRGLAAEIWDGANSSGERTGRAVAWFCSGGPGWKIARAALERKRRADAPASRGMAAPGSASYGLAQYAASPHRGGLPGEVWKPHAGWVGRRPDPGYWVAEASQRCEVCGQRRRLCPRCGYLDAGLPSPVGCSGQRW